MEALADAFGEVSTSRMQMEQLGSVPWTSLELCAFAVIHFFHAPELLLIRRHLPCHVGSWYGG